MKFRKYNHYLFTNLVASVAFHHKIPFKIISGPRSIIKVDRSDGTFTRFRRYHNNLNHPKHKLISDNKFKCGKWLRLRKLPATKQAIILTKTKKMPDFLHNWAFPVVVKQINGTGGKNVWTNCFKWEHVQRALKKAAIKNMRKVLIEEQVQGDDYRVLVINGKIIDCIRRRAPRVVGDGTRTVGQLIKDANKKKKYRMKPEPRVLHKQGLKLRSVPASNQIVQVSGLCNYHQGGTLARIPIDEISEENREMFLLVAKELNLRVAGIDFISTNIKDSYKINGGRITEVNADANLDLHYTTYPRTMEFVEKAVLEMLK
jgi:cyanophycin synthetase